jgi:hypothetical protein
MLILHSFMPAFTNYVTIPIMYETLKTPALHFFTLLSLVQNKMNRFKKVVSLTQLLGALTAAQLIIPHLPTRLKSKAKQLQNRKYLNSFSSEWPKQFTFSRHM